MQVGTVKKRIFHVTSTKEILRPFYHSSYGGIIELKPTTITIQELMD